MKVANDPRRRRAADPRIMVDPIFDLGIGHGCPKTAKYALDISTVAVPSIGDEVVSGGFGGVGYFWHGHVSEISKRECRPAIHWNDSDEFSKRICSGEIMVQGSGQGPGTSGSAVANGYGYVGMGRATLVTDIGSMYAAVVPAWAIIDLIRKSPPELLLPVSSCDVKVLQLPRFGRFPQDDAPTCIAVPAK